MGSAPLDTGTRHTKALGMFSCRSVQRVESRPTRPPGGADDARARAYPDGGRPGASCPPFGARAATANPDRPGVSAVDDRTCLLRAHRNLETPTRSMPLTSRPCRVVPTFLSGPAAAQDTARGTGGVTIPPPTLVSLAGTAAMVIWGFEYFPRVSAPMRGKERLRGIPSFFFFSSSPPSSLCFCDDRGGEYLVHGAKSTLSATHPPRTLTGRVLQGRTLPLTFLLRPPPADRVTGDVVLVPLTRESTSVQAREFWTEISSGG